MSRFDYNQARQASILAGTNLTALYNQLGPQNLLNYVTNSSGFTTFVSYPLKRSFARVGISYGYTIQNVRTLTDAATTYYDYINFLHINGPNPLEGIKSSTITPSFTYNSVNHPITPTARQERLPGVASVRGQRSGRKREPDRADGRREVFPQVAAEPEARDRAALRWAGG